MKGSGQGGFRITVSVATVAIFSALVVTGLSLYQRHQQPKQSVRQQPTMILDAAQVAATTASWSTYNDNGYAAASGLSIKYPPDWEISIPGVGKFGNTSNPTAVIYERVVFLPSSETPKDEWNTCAAQTSADACGAALGDQTLSGAEFTINGLPAYTATMQNSNGTYHVIVIRSSKSTSAAGAPYAEFTTTSNDPAVLNAFSTVLASATPLN